MEPHLARDIAAAPRADCTPEGFAVDPRPLRGIGLMPQPMMFFRPGRRAAAIAEQPPSTRFLVAAEWRIRP
jgi:hypothetical protein